MDREEDRLMKRFFRLRTRRRRTRSFHHLAEIFAER
jgi:hypothetical protein